MRSRRRRYNRQILSLDSADSSHFRPGVADNVSEMTFTRRDFTGALAASIVWPKKLTRKPAKSKGFVRADGKNLVDPEGRRLLLRGINLGNWLEPEGYMFLFEDGPQSPREIEQFFSELVGPNEAEIFWREYRRRFITEADIQFIKQSGANSVRIPFHYKYFVSGEEGFHLLDSVIDWCKDSGPVGHSGHSLRARRADRYQYRR